MAFDFKAATPDISIDANAFLFGADTQAAANPSIFQLSVIKAFMSDSPTLVTPTLGVAAGTSLALGGATIGSNALAVTGSALFGAAIITGPAAASLQFGAADAAAPVAQTLGVQSVVAGTANTSGTKLTIKGSAGTGTGLPGGIEFQTAPAGSAGSSQNAFVARLTLDVDAANTLALRNGTAAQTFNIYNTYTDASNYARVDAGYISSLGIYGFASASAGTGSAFPMYFGTKGSAVTYLMTNATARWQVATDGMFLASTDNAYDIGGSGAARPRALYLGTNIGLPAGTTTKAPINMASGVAPTSPVDGDIWFDGTNLKIRVSGVTYTFTKT